MLRTQRLEKVLEMNAFNNEWEKEKKRQSRIDAQLSVLPPHQEKRLKGIQRDLELALARQYAHRLHPRVSARIVEGIVLEPECLCTIGGGVNEMPTTAEGWDALAKDLAQKEPLAVLSIDSNDAALKEEIRLLELQSLRPEQRLLNVIEN